MSIVSEIGNPGHQPETIDEFLKKFPVPPEDVELLLDYPGPRPDGSYITDGEHLVPLSDDPEEFHEQTNTLLAQAKVPLLEDRIPVVAYGANASPRRLQKKMADFGPDAQNLMQIVPHISATIPNALAVWHGRPGQVGSCFAELYPSEQEGTALQAHVAFLTPEQLTALGITEGVTYSEAELTATIGKGETAREVPVVAYVALQASVLLKDGKPVLIKGLKNTGAELPEMTAREAVEYMLDAASGDIGKTTIEDFVHEGRQLKLKEKKERQARVQASLARQGLSQEFAFPAPEGALIGRADLASLPGRSHTNIIAMPELTLAAIRPSKNLLKQLAAEELKDPETKYATEEEARRKLQDKLDPARRLAKRAHDELEVRLKLGS